MDRITLRKSGPLRGEIEAPPDKSISHRAIIFSSISEGRTAVRNILRAGDTLSTLNAMVSLGVDIEDGKEVVVNGKGLKGLKEPISVIDCGNSGTTMRLLSGLLSGCPFFSVLTGDDSLRSRPMGRVTKPLAAMGASLMARDNDKYPPIAIKGGGLTPLRYEMPVASAQVKSALILAGLSAEGVTEVVEPARSRDHTERMLLARGARLSVDGLSVKIEGSSDLKAIDTEVPGDFSSAAFFIVAACITEGSEVLVKNVGLNPTRAGLLDVLLRMGARIEIINRRETSGEPVGDVLCGTSSLKTTDISEGEIPSLIDELPVFFIAAARAKGKTTLRGAGELRVKESDRLKAMAAGLKSMGVKVEEFPDGMSIEGPAEFKGSVIDGYKDHRIVMSFAVASLVAGGETVISGVSAVDISFPGFFETLRRISS